MSLLHLASPNIRISSRAPLIIFIYLQNIVAVAMLVRRFDFQMALGAPPVSYAVLTYFLAFPFGK